MANEVEQLVERYIQVRDKKQEIANAAKEKIAKLDALLKKMEGALLATFQDAGIESAKCSSGTAYRSTRSSATVADWEACLNYIRENDLWHMLERRVSKDAVVQFREEHNDLPPGVNFREEIVVNVRRAAA